MAGMLCAEGEKLKDVLADASSLFSNQASVDVRELPVRNRLQAENLHVKQQEALRAFTQHVETCSVCNEGTSSVSS